jgi:hypothetical protein
MKFNRVLQLVVPFLLLAVSAFSQNMPTAQPFFFPQGIQQTTDLLRQREEYMHIFQGTWACNQGGNGGLGTTLPGSDSISVVTDVVSTSSVTENPAKMKIVIDHAYKMPDGRIRYTSLCGQYYITEDQLKVVEDTLTQIAVIAAKRDNVFYGVVAEKATTARAAKLGIKREELVAQLDEKVPGYNITFRELHRLPKPSKASDFIPRELHLGYNPPLGGILGVTWLNTGVIYYNPNAWMTDYVNTVPKIMQHEMVHGNINFEKFPMSEAFDVELMADMPIVLYSENTTDFPTHGYATDIRELAEIYYGFDWDQFRSDTVKFDFAGNIVYDDAKYVYYYKQIDTIKAEMLTFFMDETIPEFYSDPVWWSAVNDIRGDNNSVFRMTMALHYNPTILGSAAKTMDWLESHREEIKEIGDGAFRKGLGGDKGGMVMDMSRIPPSLVSQYNSMFTAQERENIETFFRAHPEKLAELQHMSPVEALQFLGTFKSNSKGMVQP